MTTIHPRAVKVKTGKPRLIVRPNPISNIASAAAPQSVDVHVEYASDGKVLRIRRGNA